jgi:hypothetical protein
MILLQKEASFPIVETPLFNKFLPFSSLLKHHCQQPFAIFFIDETPLFNNFLTFSIAETPLFNNFVPFPHC